MGSDFSDKGGYSGRPDRGEGVPVFPGEGVLLAIDWGERRVGLALSDRHRRFAWPVDPVIRERSGTYSRKSDHCLLSVIQSLMETENVVGLVFGVPYYHLSGDPNPKASDFLQVGRDLSLELSLPVLFWDEGLSSEMARNDPFARRKKKKSGKKSGKDPWIDSKSASLILESFLTAMRSPLNKDFDGEGQNGKEDSLNGR